MAKYAKKAELNFDIQRPNGGIIPIEVKSSEHVRSKVFICLYRGILLLCLSGFPLKISDLRMALNQSRYMLHFAYENATPGRCP